MADLLGSYPDAKTVNLTLASFHKEPMLGRRTQAVQNGSHFALPYRQMAKSPTKPAPKAFGTLGSGRMLEPERRRVHRDFSTLAVCRGLIPLALSSMGRFFRSLVAAGRTRSRVIIFVSLVKRKDGIRERAPESVCSACRRATKERRCIRTVTAGPMSTRSCMTARAIEEMGGLAAVKKRAVYARRTVCGVAAYAIIRSLYSPTLPPDTSYEDIVLKLTVHFNPRPSVIVQWFQFGKHGQWPGESIADYIRRASLAVGGALRLRVDAGRYAPRQVGLRSPGRIFSTDFL
ncbi:hypothetical protein HPB47_010417 [Ixodes persulcatus]|uniref:Uncharacterized protein n=1 Tax=Ixodes persulcatus TaxID=34615 RepID=A0AC60NZ69_IXOPE|nr:hypothetical protein HPB47_010417 [Ixodes persulcatus]